MASPGVRPSTSLKKSVLDSADGLLYCWFVHPQPIQLSGINQMKSSIVVCCCISILVPCHSGSCLAQSTSESITAQRIIAPIDESQRLVLKGNVHPLAKSQFDRGPAPVADPAGRMQLLLRRSPVQQQALIQHLSDLQNPTSLLFTSG